MVEASGVGRGVYPSTLVMFALALHLLACAGLAGAYTTVDTVVPSVLRNLPSIKSCLLELEDVQPATKAHALVLMRRCMDPKLYEFLHDMREAGIHGPQENELPEPPKPRRPTRRMQIEAPVTTPAHPQSAYENPRKAWTDQTVPWWVGLAIAVSPVGLAAVWSACMGARVFGQREHID